VPRLIFLTGPSAGTLAIVYTSPNTLVVHDQIVITSGIPGSYGGESILNLEVYTLAGVDGAYTTLEVDGPVIIDNSAYSATNALQIYGPVTASSNVTVGGHLGIGTTPAYPLDVAGAGITYTGLNFVFSTYSTFTSNVNTPYIGHFNGGILASYYGSVSDRRIKKNISSINLGNALTNMRLINPVTYNYIDTLARGSNAVMGFIAQQVSEGIPSAVTPATHFIPNIYSAFNISTAHIVGNTCCLMISLTDPVNSALSSMSTAAFYSAYFPNDCNVLTTVSSILNDILVLDTNSLLSTNTSTGFMYGQQVSDFNTLNKDYLYTMNFAATQDLDLIVQNQQSTISGLTNIIHYICSTINLPLC
jgi:hypothetical protein